MPRREAVPESLLKLQEIYETYARYNKAYWKGALPWNVTINIVSPEGTGFVVDLKKNVVGGSVFCPEFLEEPLIELSAILLDDGANWRRVLAHEMCHLAIDYESIKKTGRATPVKTQHGKAFKQETAKLAKLGFLEEIL